MVDHTIPVADPGTVDSDSEMVFELQPWVEGVDVDGTPILYTGDGFASFGGDSVELLSEALPYLEDGVTVVELSDQMDVDVPVAVSLVETLLRYRLVGKQDTLRIAKDDAVRFHYARRTDREYAAAAAESFADTAMIRIPDDEVFRSELQSNFETPFEVVYRPHPDELLDRDYSVVVSITFGHSPNQHREYQERCDAAEVPFLAVRLFPDHVLVGPMSIPHETASFKAAYRRRNTSRGDPETEVAIDVALSGQYSFPLLAEHWNILETYVTGELRSVVSGTGNAATENAVIKYDVDTLETSTIDILRLPEQVPQGDDSEWL